MDDLREKQTVETTPDPARPGAWQDALLAARLLKAGGPEVGGLWLKARAGGVRDSFLAHLKDLLGSSTPWTRVPGSVSHSALQGSIDIPATAKTGKVVVLPGLLARADEGVLLLPMAERLDAATAAIIGNVMDSGYTRSPSAKTQGCDPVKARFQVIAIDESASAEEHLPAALSDRLGLVIDLNAVSWSEAAGTNPAVQEKSRLDWRQVTLAVPVFRLLSEISCAAGRPSLRTLRHLSMIARMLAATEGRNSVRETDALVALRLCLGIRPETQSVPEEEDVSEGVGPTEPDPCQVPQSLPPETESGQEDQERTANDLTTLTELLAAVEAGSVAGLPELSANGVARSAVSRTGKAGTPQKNARRGRPVAVSRTAPFPDARPNIIATLRAAAPWQVIRSQNRAILLSRLSERDARRVRQPRALITRDDYRFQRLRHETPSTAIFMVDASGSTALERLGETKGAIEQLLSRCYVRRDEVAMIAFRGKGAETVLPPTRSLVMAKRKLAGLPGGGPTPLVSGLEKGLELALSVRRQGSTPVMVLLTDGRGNIARNGEADRTRAQEELGLVAGQYRSLEMRSICIDIARRPRESVASLAQTMGADLHFLRHADAGSMSDVVNASLEEARG